jgi:hypothetical protein
MMVGGNHGVAGLHQLLVASVHIYIPDGQKTITAVHNMHGSLLTSVLNLRVGLQNVDL